MPNPILATKLYIPPPRSQIVLRPQLIARLNEGLQHSLTLISASAGFGKTTLVSAWLAACDRPAAWLSLDEGDNEASRFLAYLIAALQTLAPHTGSGVLAALQSPQPPPTEILLTTLLNEIAALPSPFILVLDDLHAIDSKPVEQALAFLVEHLPRQMHLVIATREDPPLPLARLRARGQLAELRAADLRFTPAEAADFLNRVMGLDLSTEDIAALEARTEGWIAGLQLAALALQRPGQPAHEVISAPGHPDTASFIKSFTGSHHFVLDYLMEEVLQQQPEAVQAFLLRTAILDRMCGPLCDAIMHAGDTNPAAHGQTTLEYLERANLFIIPLDNQRRWYRYHHLFADLLRQRLEQQNSAARITGLHIRASQWYEDNGLVMEAFHHAIAANDIDRAERLIESGEMPLHIPGAATRVLDWLETLPTAVLDARPALWARFASMSLVNGRTEHVEERLRAAEAALQGVEQTPNIRNLIGIICAARATLSLTRYQAEQMMNYSQRALEYLPPENLGFRTTALWVLGYANFLKGDRAAAGRAMTEGLALSQISGDLFTSTLALSGLGFIQELENKLYQAAESYRRCLELFGDPPLSNACEVYLGLARIYYEWNDIAAAEQHGQKSLELANQYERGIDRYIISDVFLARLKLAQGDVAGAAAILAQAEQSARQYNFVFRLPEIAAEQVMVLLRQGNLSAGAQIAQAHRLPLSQARVQLAQGDTAAAIFVAANYRKEMETRGWADERLKALVFQAAAMFAHFEKAQALELLSQALELAEPGGFIRLFVDEGPAMAQLLSAAAAQGIQPNYTARLLAAFAAEAQKQDTSAGKVSAANQPLVEPLTARELEVLRLVAQGLSNQEIGERLYLALNTVKGHNRVIFDKLQVQSRTEAVARARELGLL